MPMRGWRGVLWLGVVQDALAPSCCQRASAGASLSAPAFAVEAVSSLLDAHCAVDPLDRRSLSQRGFEAAESEGHARSPLYYAAVSQHRDVVATCRSF